MRVHHVSCEPAVNESERKAIAQIRSRLGSQPGEDDWFLLTNLPFSTSQDRQSDEVDIIAVGPPGVQIVEVKHWSANWVKRNGEIVEREAERVTSKARKIGTTLRKHVSELPRVDGVFLVTQATNKTKSLEGDTVRGVPFHTLRTCEDSIGFFANPALSPQRVKRLAEILEPRSRLAADGTLKRMGGYGHLQLQTPEDQRFHRVYKATHVSRRDNAILHVYDLSATDDPNNEEKAEREWQSLQRLRRYTWAPVIIDSFHDAPGYEGEIKYFTVADPVAPAIEERIKDNSWTTEARLRFARAAVRALTELHGADGDDGPMIHRNLTPATILVGGDNSPIFTGFEYARIPKAATVASSTTSRDWDPTTPPEVRAQGRTVADKRSDVYALCASLKRLFTDRTETVDEPVVAALAKGMTDDPAERVGLSDLEASLSNLLHEPDSETTRETPTMPARFWAEDQIVPFRNRHYRIVASLGSGGTGTAFKVVEIDQKTGHDVGTYVAKVAHDADGGERILYAYRRARSVLNHPALSNIFEYADEWRDNSFVALMAWIEGVSLSEYIGLLELVADEFREDSDKILARRWLQTICEALQVLHDSGLIHGDISPSNMIISKHDLFLTDYDCVTKIGNPVKVAGTAPYCVPLPTEGRNAAPSDDFYALAASFFHVLFGREPFRYDGALAKERGLNWGEIDLDEDPALVAFLNRATNPNPQERFSDASEALAALETSLDQRAKNVDGQRTGPEPEPSNSGPPAPPVATPAERPERRQNEVPWLKSLLQSYPGSQRGNRETRGLDSDFASKTYVETSLEEMLYEAIRERTVRLVVLCGNAGDGKTAVLQRLAERLGLPKKSSATRILKGRLENGLTVRMNLDGSASWGERSATDLLDDFLAPFQNGEPDEDIVHLLAINDGRLLEWVEASEKNSGETQLTRDLSEFLQEPTSESASHIFFVDLNQRSLVGGIATNGSEIETGFLTRLVDGLYGKQSGEDWRPCQTCSAQDRCEVFRASRLFGPDEIADNGLARQHARERLFEALQAVHLRGETHITIRELRAALIYILFGTHYCSDYHEPSVDTDPYWNRAFSPASKGRQGEVLRELPRFDPALEAHPQIDRRLLQSQRDAVPDHNNNLGNSELHNGLYDLASRRRRAWFEWTEKDIADLTGDPNSLGLAEGRHLREFRDLAIIQNEDTRTDLTRRICGGISRLEALPPQALERDGVVALRIAPKTPTETAFWVEKPADRFRLEADIPASGGNGMERLHRHAFLVYRYSNGDEERLRLGADLFHVLLEINDGYQLGDIAADDTFAHLSIFVQRLVQEDHRRMMAWNPMKDDGIYDIEAQIVTEDSAAVQRLVIAPVEGTGESDV